MRFNVAVLLCLVAACAGGGAYERGAAARPPPSPSVTPIGVGAPEVGQPGQQPSRDGLARSPNRRHVAPRKDGGPVIAAADGDDERAVRLMFTQPATACPEGIAPTAHAKCWEDVKTLLKKDPRVLKLTHVEARCLRIIVYNHCGARMIEQADNGNADFLARFPERPRPVTTGHSPRAREVGRYNQHDFEEATSGRRNARECGQNHEYWTVRVSDLMRDLVRHGDDVMDWRNP